MIRAIGIDLGTTNTVAAMMKRGEPKEIQNRKGSYVTPSALALTNKGDLLVGDDARSKDVGVVMSFKRDMGTDRKIEFNKRSYTPMELSALVLRRVKTDVEVTLGEPVSRAVITVPAWFSERAIVETRDAGRMAGFFVLRTFSEPMAAALAYGIDREDTEPKTILVYDLGGGTFDISVLMVTPGTFAALDHEGDLYLGGDDFDLMLVNHFYEQGWKDRGIRLADDERTRVIITRASEKAKIELSSRENADVIGPTLGREGIDIDMPMSRLQFEAMLMPWIVGPRHEGKKSTMELVHQAIANSQLDTETIDNILLVGGSTYIPLVCRALAEVFGEKKVLKVMNPMLCVAHGAAIETSLIREVDCPQCHHKNGLDAMKCQECGLLLVGEEKVDCPICFLPSPATDKKCWKCGSELRRTVSPMPALSKKCPQGHENALDATNCSKQGCGHTFETGGIMCPTCRHVNKEGVAVCAKCGTESWGRNEVTSKDRGIELIDGGFDVIVLKGTEYPSTSTVHKLYSTPEANVRHLEFTLYEGESNLAKQNEWLGELVLELPPGLPSGTLVDISIHLEADSAMLVSAKLVEQPLTAMSVRIERMRGGSQSLREIEELLKKARALYESGRENLSGDKRKRLAELMDELEKTRQKLDASLIESKRSAWEQFLIDCQDEIEARNYIDRQISLAERTLTVARDFVDANNKAKIENLVRETKEDLSKDNLVAARGKAKELEQFLESLGNVMLLVYGNAWANDSRVSSSVSSRLIRAVDEVKEAAAPGSKKSIVSALEEVNRLIGQAYEDVRRAGGHVDVPKKPIRPDTGLGNIT